jgi:hypothetical protein
MHGCTALPTLLWAVLLFSCCSATPALASTSQWDYTYTTADRDLLARTLYGEANGESREGQLGRFCCSDETRLLRNCMSVVQHTFSVFHGHQRRCC